MAIKYACKCGRKFSAEDRYAGRKTRCVHCGAEFEIPLGRVAASEKRARPPEPSPLPTATEQHLVAAGQDASRPLWRDPIISYGVGVPLLFLLVFFGYVVWSRLEKHDGNRVQDGTVAVIQLPKKGQPASAVLRADGDSVKEIQPTYAVLHVGGDTVKEIFHVRLPRKPTVEGLRSLAYDVKARHGGKRPRTIIWFCLPGRRCPQSSWAFADFNPDLRVELRGLTIQDEQALLAQPLPAHTELIGDWFDDAEDPSRYIIYRTSEGLFVTKMGLGSTTGVVEELVEKPAYEGERKFERKKGSRAGDRYLVGADGNFEIRDDSGTILNGKRVESGAQQNRRPKVGD